MWKCPNCETMNEDEELRCIICDTNRDSAAVPDIPKCDIPEEESKSANKRVGGKTIGIIGVGIGLGVILIICLMFKNESSLSNNKIGENEAPAQSSSVSVAPVYLTMGFGDMYYCTPDDFNLAGKVTENVKWACAVNSAGLECSADGVVHAGNILVDPEQTYNAPIKVSGTMEDGPTLIYYIETGVGQSYTFGWSDVRNMRSYNGPVYQVSPMVENCLGFTLSYMSTLTSGEIVGDNWSVWVRENGTDWVYIQDIILQDGVEGTYDIKFDEQVSFSEIAVQPPKQMNAFTNIIDCVVKNLIFG